MSMIGATEDESNDPSMCVVSTVGLEPTLSGA